MAKSKKNNKQASSRPSVKVRDLRPNKNPKGGVQKIRESFYSKITLK